MVAVAMVVATTTTTNDFTRVFVFMCVYVVDTCVSYAPRACASTLSTPQANSSGSSSDGVTRAISLRPGYIDRYIHRLLPCREWCTRI